MMESEIKVIFWDFDGVLMDSNAVRDLGFEEVLKDYPEDQVAELMAYHRKNGGLSRYVKFRYFFENIRNNRITDEEVMLWAERFSVIMKRLLLNPELLIQETLDFVQANHKQIPMHIVSGSDQDELRYLCDTLGIGTYFVSIHGSPKPKTQWVGELLHEHGYPKDNCLLIGDSRNDYEAAMDNGIAFMGYNSADVASLSTFTMPFQ